MSFLRCTPSVFVIGSEYEILINTLENGIIFVDVAGESYYEENSGVLSSEKDYAKIRIPQEVLNKTKSYTVHYQKTINRKAYCSEMAEEEIKAYTFKPLEKTENINIYHVADVHYRFENAVLACSYFGEELDLLVVNGDIGEVETVKNYNEVAKFCGDISKGEVPIIFARGNHDTRGKLAERFTDYFPADGKKTYFKFEIGSLCGVVIDCGEDKNDNHLDHGFMKYWKFNTPYVYGGVNRFHEFRQKELSFLQNTTLDNNKIRFAICHCPPVMVTDNKDSAFNIEKDCYTKWNAELERMGIQFMLCGHFHKNFVLKQGDERNIIDHKYPVLVGSQPQKENFIGVAITLNRNKMEVVFNDKNHAVVDRLTVDF